MELLVSLANGVTLESVLSLALVTVASFLAYLGWWKRFTYSRNFIAEDIASGKIAKGAARGYRPEEYKEFLATKHRFPNSWYAACTSDEVRSDRPKRLNLLGLELVAWRDKEGKLVMADAYCPHLGAHLAEDGIVSDGCVTCPFHFWTFDATGKCVHIPGAEKIPAVAKIKIRESFEANGFAYFWYHEKEEKPSWTPKAYPETEDGRMKLRGKVQITFQSNIKDVMRNLTNYTTFKRSPIFENATSHCMKGVYRTNWAVKSPLVGLETGFRDHYFRGMSLFTSEINAEFEGPASVAKTVRVFGQEFLVFIMFTPFIANRLTITAQIYSKSGSLGAPLLAASVTKMAFDEISSSATAWHLREGAKKGKGLKTPCPGSGTPEFETWYDAFYSPPSVQHSEE